MGWCQLEINGRLATNIGATLEPGWSQWDARMLYSTYDVTDIVEKYLRDADYEGGGAIAVGVAFGGGWPGHLGHKQAAKLLLSVDMADGTRVIVRTAQEGAAPQPTPHKAPQQPSAPNTHAPPTVLATPWRASWGGPITSDDIYDGEKFDGRVATQFAGWSTPAFDASAWPLATDPKDPTLGASAMSAQPQPPIRKFQLLDPISVTQPLGKTVDVLVSDFGQNIAGWARLSVANCPSGTLITLRFAEVLCGRGPTTWSKACSPPGVVDQRNLRAARATDTYTCSGEAEEVWEPRTTYHGFRFVQVMHCTFGDLIPGTPLGNRNLI